MTGRRAPGPAIVLLSGGMDSATTLAIARKRGHRPLYALTIVYGQRHEREVRSARILARRYGACWILLEVPLARIAASALTRPAWKIPSGRSEREIGRGIPTTYVPARNTVFLSLALALSETTQAKTLYLGVNAIDYSGYPDCRPEYLRAFQRLARLATARGVEGRGTPRIVAPLLHKSKADIVRWGNRLGVPWDLTWSCYRGGAKPCGECDACLLRARGFAEVAKDVNKPRR